MSEQPTDDLKATYQQVCEGYRAIDEMRTKLLGLLPLTTGAGILILSGRGSASPSVALAAAIGSFGILATLGLFSYELHSMKETRRAHRRWPADGATPEYQRTVRAPTTGSRRSARFARQ
jgi:hypothetical protein